MKYIRNVLLLCMILIAANPAYAEKQKTIVPVYKVAKAEQKLLDIEAEARFLEKSFNAKKFNEDVELSLKDIGSLIEASSDKLDELTHTLGSQQEVVYSDLEFYLLELERKISNLEKMKKKS